MNDKLFNKILYVEDDVAIQKIVEVSLGNIGGYKLKMCDCGKDALLCAVNFNPDLFLFDIMLPDMNGLSILEELRKNPVFKDTPAIFISAKFIGHQFAEYRKAGVRGIIRKPFDYMSLNNLILAIYTGNKELIPEINERDYRIL